jgi:hypothetical protein
MKNNLSFLLIGLLLAIGGYGQAPGIFNYQGVARNSVGNALINQNISLRLTIHDVSAAGPIVYQETRAVTTNPFGLFNVQVGSSGASSITGTIAGVNWAVGSKFVQVEIDPAGGTSFINIGTAQLASVPYAVNAAGAAPIGPAGGDLAGSTYPNPIIAPLVVTTGKITDGAVTTQKITFPLTKTQADAVALIGMTNSGAGSGIEGTNTGTGRGGFFQVLNPANTSDAVRAETNGSGASWAVRAISTGTNGAGLFQQTNAANTANNLQSNQGGLGRAGLFNSTNAASTANAVDINVAGTGFALRAASSNATPKALLTTGSLQFTGIGEALNKVLVSDAAGNATWQTPAAIGGVTGSGTLNFVPKWTPGGTNLGNSLLFDDGANVGIGTTTPTHRFTVSHSGSTGILNKSSAGFSVLDIDAFSGDAAIRFANNGVNQWNMRNQPGTDNLQFFELGGGGERMSIQNTTGNIAIGGSAGAYRLDILHGGSTGILNKSSAGFSVLDIDAFSGDAAIRFANNGVNQWNIRNRPGDDYLEIFELGGGGSRVVIQDATGNVGIGETTAPAYKLDVLHGGSTGIRSRSSASFSVVDIDAQSGDAALRFQKAGVNQWNVRNRPADDYFEIFELGGGGSRVVIQDATGNVGIGETTAPAYKLDVLHGGSTGIRSRSSSSFSVVDIDAQSGDAALRFQKAGVNQWNTRNNPATDDYQIFELGGGGERMRIDNTTGKVWVNGDFTVLGAKAFTMDYPLDPTNKTLMHAAVESNEVMNFYSGNITTDADGKAIVSLPEYFEAINKDFRYQLTVIGTFAQAIISKEVINNKFEIATNQPNVKVSWEVKGVRNDARMQKNPFVAVQDKTPVQKGKYLDPASYNQPASKGVSYDPNIESSLSDVKPVPQKAAIQKTGGSLDQGSIIPPSSKVIDKSGSVESTQVIKPAEKKSVDAKGTSIEDVKKTPAPEKKASEDPGTTKTD